jgi:aminopeptidase
VPGPEPILEPDARARYADAVVQAGVAVRRLDVIVLHGQPRHRELLVALSEAAYRNGARHVELDVDDPLVSAARFRAGGKHAIGARSPWETARARALIRDDDAIVHIAGEGEPGAYDGIDPKLLARDAAAVRKQLSFYVKATLSGRIRWAIAGWPTEPWATQVYPELDALEAQRRLARDLLWFCRLGTEDGEGTSGWVAHVKALETRRRALTRQKLTRLTLRGPGTELTIGVPSGALWLGGRERSASGRLFSPNMPTEEVFTSPDPAATEGPFRCSRPLEFRGRTIEGIAGEFRDGRLVRLEAARDEDRDLLAAFLDTDANARRLGEVALVDASSRIGRAGRTYFNTLLDENAAAHIAFGAGFPNTRESGARGVNRSVLHLDVMIGTDDFEVQGETARGRQAPLIAGGLWQL